MPEKKRMKVKWVRLRRKWELVLWIFRPLDKFALGLDLVAAFVVTFGAVGVFCNFALATLEGNVSGSARYKYNVSVTTRKSEKPAAVAKGFAFTLLIVLNHAPRAGPNVNEMLKHIPTNAIVDPRCFSSEISVAIAMASCTFPSESPPTILERRKVRKSVAQTQSRTERMFPAILQRRAVRRPYLSERVPITGEANACRSLCAQMLDLLAVACFGSNPQIDSRKQASQCST
jgi:hypothetical protein